MTQQCLVFVMQIKHKLQRNGGHCTMSASSAYQQRLSPVLPSASACVPAAALPSPTSSMPIKIPHATTSSSSSTFTAPRGTPGKARGSVEGLNQVYIVNYYHQLMRSHKTVASTYRLCFSILVGQFISTHYLKGALD